MATNCQTLEDFSCAICQCVLEDPVSLSCGTEHVACKQCATTLLKEEDAKCPICRILLRSKRLRSNKNLAATMRNTSIPCFGCKQNILVSDMNHHQTLCDRIDKNISYFKPVKETTQRIPKNLPNRSTFQCPYCGLANLDNAGLLTHCNTKHAHSLEHVVCPICASMPWGDKSQTSTNFIQHLNIRHKFEYDTYVDYGQDDDAMLMAAIQASLENS